MRALDHARGAAVLFAAFAMLVLGFPGLDALSATAYPEGSTARRNALKQRNGAWVVRVHDLNRWIRVPVVEALTPLQRPLRLAQSWSLYSSGPGKLHRMEILVDDRLVYRSNDREHTWLDSQLRYRKIRPIVDTTCLGKSKNDKGLVDYIVAKARARWPEARAVRVQCTEQFRRPDDTPRVVQSYEARAPGWEQER